MPRIDYIAGEHDIDPRKLAEATLTVLVQQLNALRALHGLPAFTRSQVVNAIKQELRK